MNKIFKIGHTYKDVLSVSKEKDQFVSWFAHNGSGIGNSGGIRAAKFLNIHSTLPSYLVLITRNISHRWHNPWEDIIDYSSGTIFYWGDAKFTDNKSYEEFRGNKHFLNIFERILENDLSDVPPILHFSKTQKGKVNFNGLCVMKKLELTWFQDSGVPVKNYRCELAILDTENVEISWLHSRVNCLKRDNLNDNAPRVWKNYINGNIQKLDIWSKSILNKEDQLPLETSEDNILLKELCALSPTQFEAVVVELFRNLPNVNHQIARDQTNSRRRI